MKKLIALLMFMVALGAQAQSYPSPTYATTTTNNLQVNTGVSVGPVPSSLVKAFTTAQAPHGSSPANCTSTTLIVYPCANSFYISADDVAAGLTSSTAYDEWQFAANFGGSNLTGARQIMDVIGHFTAPSSASNVNTGYDAAAFEMITNSGDGGTAPTTANGRGSFFATNPLVIANSGATNLFGIAGEEVDVGCNGCTTAIRFGISLANFGTTQAAVLGNDAALHIGSIGSGTTGSWHQAINLSSVNGGAPLDTGGCVICTDTTASTIQTGIDLHSWTITGNFLAGPNGFQVTGAGAVVVPSGLGITAGGLAVNAGGASITGGLVVAGAGPFTATGLVTLADHATQAANTIIGNGTASTASPTALAVPSCSTSASALDWTSGTGFSCNTAINAATLSGNAIGTSGATVPLLNGANTWSGANTFTSTITPSQTNGIVGTTTNNNANAGSVGEYFGPTTTGTSMTSNTGANCASQSLTAGDYDVSGTVGFNAASTTTIQALDLGISTTSATIGGLGTATKLLASFTTGAVTDVLSTPVVRESLSATTTVYLVGLASFGVSTMTCDGALHIRRVR